MDSYNILDFYKENDVKLNEMPFLDSYFDSNDIANIYLMKRIEIKPKLECFGFDVTLLD